MSRDVSSLIKPATIAVIGASAKKRAQGNAVIDNLLSRECESRIIPVHRSAETIQGLVTVPAIEDLPDNVDLAIASVPAAAAFETALALESRGVKSAIFFASGFSQEDADTFRSLATESTMNIQGPNCMGLINLNDGLFLYPATTSSKIRAGRVAFIAQSGSAAITLMNSAEFGISKIITVGSEFQLTAADYMNWLATDDDTAAIGIVLEAIKDADAFARAARRVFETGKSLVVLKVGNSAIGSAATLAHTGSMTSDADTYRLFFEANGIATVADYDELNAALEILSRHGQRENRGRLAIVGISGGQTALACDVAVTAGVELAHFSDAVVRHIGEVSPGTLAQNPIDFGSVTDEAARDIAGSIKAILNDDGIDMLAVIQDCQAGLHEKSLESYSTPIDAYCRSARDASKPIIAISATSEEIHPDIRLKFESHGIPIVSGLREGIVGAGTISRPRPRARAETAETPEMLERKTRILSLIHGELKNGRSQLTSESCLEILAAYGIPTSSSLVVANAAEAAERIADIEFPLAVKVASRHIAHRSELGGVMLGVRDMDELSTALSRIAENVAAAAPNAKIDGYELQREVRGDLEAVAGFVASPPFGVKVMVGTGGTLVELIDDLAMGLAPLTVADAQALIASTKLGKRMNGYRNLIAQTDTRPLAELVSNLSLLARDLGDLITSCDLNPVMIHAGSGEVAIVDVLMTLK
ncbi:acetate--CoA ligase family protein [Thalassobaculum litoreum]|uniref:Acyl-CoA synthetase (NDP forming) n=1 Tax=Thalassobaculum litoreum DSM 18839 TaxID=1123362 RepID=A0A8G2BL34_9PROT|nr:acetate--CoA ligase family protein [Thalassobaculum litoreum]SDG32742.1 Acyl-CoA synthetase (NDP forming) [Thalassobaculum litoreum DSM 18839]